MAATPTLESALPAEFAPEGAAYQQSLAQALRRPPGNAGLYPWLQEPATGAGYELPPTGPLKIYDKRPEEQADRDRWASRYLLKRGKNGLSDYFGYEGFDGSVPGLKPGTGALPADPAASAGLDALLKPSATMTEAERLAQLQNLLGGGGASQTPYNAAAG